MLASLRARAPDRVDVHSSQHIALGRAFLSTGAAPSEQPGALTLDGQVWVAADARIDGRSELARVLRSRDRVVAVDAPAEELILHAYAAFGEALVEHLLGDFAFALWDARANRLLCVRDHFGIRPFFYAKCGPAVHFASDVDAL